MSEQPRKFMSSETTGTFVTPVLVLVHGTGAAPEAGSDAENLPTEPRLGPHLTKRKWYEEGSQFETWLRERITPRHAGMSDDCEFIRFIWSGLNSETARNEAASELGTLIRKLAGEGRSIHFLAHSHGGNVVRRAIELTARSSAPPAAAIRSVSAFGTPFFHYSRVARLKGAAIAATILAVISGLIAWIYLTADTIKSENVQTLTIFGLLMLGGIAMYSLGGLLLTVYRLAPLRGSTAPHVAAKIDFCNIFTARDEAIGLLMSFNRSIVLMQRADFMQAWMNGPLGCGFGLTLLALLVGGTAATWERLGGTLGYLFADFWGFLITIFAVVASLLVGFVTAFLACGILGLILTLPVRLGAAIIDRMITARLRSMAYGADAGNGMVAVQTFPWEGTEHFARQMPPEIEAEIETHIGAKSTELWTRLRSGLAAGVPLLGQDLPRIVQEALTWDELSHTVYYQVEGFAELLAERLVGTGDWKMQVHRRGLERQIS